VIPGDGKDVAIYCHAGYRADEKPVAYSFGGNRRKIIEHLESRIETDPKGAALFRVFFVKDDLGRNLILSLDEKTGRWIMRKDVD